MTPSDNSFTNSPHNLALLHSTLLHSYPVPLIEGYYIYTYIYIHSTKKKVDTFSTLNISYTNSIDGKCNISYERKKSSSIRIIAVYDLEIHA